MDCTRRAVKRSSDWVLLSAQRARTWAFHEIAGTAAGQPGSHSMGVRLGKAGCCTHISFSYLGAEELSGVPRVGGHIGESFEMPKVAARYG